MSFLVRATNRGFRVIQELRKDGGKQVLTVPVSAYNTLGFRSDMTLEEAKARAKQINAQKTLESEQAPGAARRIKKMQEIECIYLDPLNVERFINELESIYFDNPYRLEINKRYWKAAQILIKELAIDPKDFKPLSHRINNYFKQQKWSHDYVKRITRILDMWGTSVCRHRGTMYERIPNLTSGQVQKLIEAHETKEHVRTEALPLSWIHLKNHEDKFKSEGLAQHWNWMVIALWFGLRPKEVDSLHDPKMWRVTTDSRKVKVLEVYQTKLVNIPKEKRWKPIPVYTKEQQEAFKLVLSGEFKRPLNKTLRRILGTGIETYSPRKGFTDLMLERGFDLEDISTFMGHQSIEMTWRTYKNKKSFKLPKLG